MAHDLYERYFARVPTAVYVLQNTFFRLKFADDAGTTSNETMLELDVQALLKMKREKRIYSLGSRSKCVVSADVVESGYSRRRPLFACSPARARPVRRRGRCSALRDK